MAAVRRTGRLTSAHSKTAILFWVVGWRSGKCVPDFVEGAGGCEKKPVCLRALLRVLAVPLVEKKTTSGAHARRRRARSLSCDSTHYRQALGSDAAVLNPE